jgi:hypothetical protein
MNKELLTKIADWLDGPDGVDAGDYEKVFFGMGCTLAVTECGTAACIAGLAVALSGRSSSHPLTLAGQLLVLTDEQESSLFYARNNQHDLRATGTGRYLNLDDVTRVQASDCVRRFVETGEVTWNFDL